MKRNRMWILFVALMGHNLSLQAQDDCAQVLLQAERAYYAGRFGEVQRILPSCLNEGFNKEQKTEAYKLLGLSYIFSKNFEQADSALLLMLKNNPQYQLAPQDPPELKKRVNDFKIHPQFEVSANLGLIQPFFKVTEVYGPRLNYSTATYKGKTGSHLGLNLAYYFNQRISLRVGYEWQAYSFSIEDDNGPNISLLTESQSRGQWQTAVGYSFGLPKLYTRKGQTHNASLQVYGGIVYSTLKKADSYLVLDRPNSSGEIILSYSNLDQRTKNEIRPFLELKINLPQKNNWVISLNVRYERGLTNMTDSNNRYSSIQRATTFEWIEDDFMGRYLVGMIGISKLFYRIKQK